MKYNIILRLPAQNVTTIQKLNLLFSNVGEIENIRILYYYFTDILMSIPTIQHNGLSHLPYDSRYFS